MIKKEVEETLARLNLAKQSEEERKRKQKEADQAEINRLFNAIEVRGEILIRSAKDFLQPLVTALHESGVLEVLSELKQEMAISGEINVSGEVKYFYKGKEDREPPSGTLYFSGIPLKCGAGWGWLPDRSSYDYSIESGKEAIEHLKDRLESVNSINVTGKHGFQTTGLRGELSWEAFSETIRGFVPDRPGIDWRPPVYRQETIVVTNKIMFNFDCLNTDTIYISDGLKSSGTYFVGDNRILIPKEKFTFPRKLWGDRDLLRKKVAEAYVRRAQVKPRT